MKRVLKWAVPVDGYAHAVGVGLVVLVECQSGPDTVHVWTEESDGCAPERLVRAYGTGQTIPDHAMHVGSVMAPLDAASAVLSGATSLVWHLYEEPAS